MSGDRRFQQIETWDVIRFYFLQSKAPKEIHTILTEIFGEHAPEYAIVKNLVAFFIVLIFQPSLRFVLDEQKQCLPRILLI
jgi:hypothetical protein